MPLRTDGTIIALRHSLPGDLLGYFFQLPAILALPTVTVHHLISNRISILFRG